MAKYAVIRIGGKQFKVSEKDEILVDKIVDLKKIEPEVLLFANDEKAKIGSPVVKDVKIKTKVVSEIEKGEKVEVYKFKSKSRYKRHTGFRAKYTRLLVEKID